MPRQSLNTFNLTLNIFSQDLESVLSNSYRVNNDIGFIGSVNILTLGINFKTGKVNILN